MPSLVTLTSVMREQGPVQQARAANVSRGVHGNTSRPRSAADRACMFFVVSE
ncbi:hypothetical protein KCP75_22240 [Salmonella enterica subsp. enterica]|nr:hypothetical protein KCP75_22240 [Salmonella enterica subsp. enterica]